MRKHDKQIFDIFVFMFNWCHRYTYTSVKTRQIFAVLLSLFFEVMVAFD